MTDAIEENGLHAHRCRTVAIPLLVIHERFGRVDTQPAPPRINRQSPGAVAV